MKEGKREGKKATQKREGKKGRAVTAFDRQPEGLKHSSLRRNCANTFGA